MFKKESRRNITKEFLLFLSMRLVSMAVELAGVWDFIVGKGAIALDFVTLLFLFLFTLMFFFLGILGIYLGDIQKECKRKPIYHVKDSYNL